MSGDFLTGEFLGLGALKDAIDRMGARADEAGKAIVAEGAALLEQKAKANFQGSHPKGQPHVGPPGGFPNVVTGSLRRSIRSDPVERLGQGEYRTSVAPRMVYGRRVELGYMGGAAYPYFEPAARAVQAELPALQVRLYRQYLT